VSASRAGIALGLLALLGMAGAPAAQQVPDSTASSHWSAFPSVRLFPVAVADPTVADFGAAFLDVTDVDIPDSGAERVELRMGGQFGIVRWRPAGERGWATQFGVEGGFNGQFDSSRQLDNIGWDGLFGFVVSAAAPSGVSLELALRHTSSHVGDEYAERTGRRRLGYTREEIGIGVSWPVTRTLRLYGGGGIAYRQKNDSLQQPWRVSGGAEFFRPGWFMQRRGGWYAAVDLSAWQERDWALDLNAQLGLFYPAGDRRFRAALGYHDGRVPIGEFFQYDERYWSLGVYVDL
jgi:hypothetical protein